MSESLPDLPSWVVLKFGGTSVSSRTRWETIANAARERLNSNERPVIVCSALSGVSNLLERLVAEVADEAATRATLEELAARHTALATELGIMLPTEVRQQLEELDTLCTGARMLREQSPRFRARVLASGELMSTRLGVAFLKNVGVSATWVDSRTCLSALPSDPGAPDGTRFLAAECAFDKDDALVSRLAALDGDVVVAQGFIASDDKGDTVLLGRGGSDTSAAYYAAKLGAERLEIWTDVPGIFSTNPHHSGTARMLREVGYNEALAMASLGAKVLHPRSVEPVREAGIPLQLRSTPQPHIEGTVLRDDKRVLRALKAVTYRNGLSMLSVRRPAQWQQVGQLADITSVFKDHGLSIDLICSSATATHVTLDPAAAPLSEEHLERMVAALEEYGDVKLRHGVGTVSIVGSGALAMLHDLAPAIESVEESDILFVVHAADGSHVTFVMPDDEVECFADRIHDGVFDGVQRRDLGPSWNELTAPKASAPAKPEAAKSTPRKSSAKSSHVAA